jgi:small-conductance mechanosensitive channel
MDMMIDIAGAHPLVAKEPPPKALFIKFGAGTMDFELRAWTDKFEVSEQVRSDLAVAINARFAEEKIGVA